MNEITAQVMFYLLTITCTCRTSLPRLKRSPLDALRFYVLNWRTDSLWHRSAVSRQDSTTDDFRYMSRPIRCHHRTSVYATPTLIRPPIELHVGLDYRLYSTLGNWAFPVTSARYSFFSLPVLTADKFRHRLIKYILQKFMPGIVMTADFLLSCRLKAT